MAVWREEAAHTPKEESAKTTLRLPMKLLAAAKHRAIDHCITLQELIERGVEMYLRTKK